MSARSGLAGKITSRPHLGPSGLIFCVGRKNAKHAKILIIFLGGPMGPIQPLWAKGALPAIGSYEAYSALQILLFFYVEARCINTFGNLGLAPGPGHQDPVPRTRHVLMKVIKFYRNWVHMAHGSNIKRLTPDRPPRHSFSN